MNIEEESSTEKFTGTMQVQEKLKIPEKELETYLNDNVDDFEGPLEVREFKGGQSNPTYQLVTPKKKYVLRRKPPGKLLPSAHAVDREYKVITAQAGKRHRMIKRTNSQIRKQRGTTVMSKQDGKIVKSYMPYSLRG